MKPLVLLLLLGSLTQANVILTDVSLASVNTAAGETPLLDAGGLISSDPGNVPEFSVSGFAPQVLVLRFSDAVNLMPDGGPITVDGMTLYPGVITGSLSWIDPGTGDPEVQDFVQEIDFVCCGFNVFFTPPDLSESVTFTLTADLHEAIYESATGYFALMDPPLSTAVPEPATWLSAIVGVGLIAYFSRKRIFINWDAPPLLRTCEAYGTRSPESKWFDGSIQDW